MISQISHSVSCPSSLSLLYSSFPPPLCLILPFLFPYGPSIIISSISPALGDPPLLSVTYTISNLCDYMGCSMPIKDLKCTGSITSAQLL